MNRHVDRLLAVPLRILLVATSAVLFHVASPTAGAVRAPRPLEIGSVTPDGPRHIRIVAPRATRARVAGGRAVRSNTGEFRVRWPRGRRCAEIEVSYRWTNAKARRLRGRSTGMAIRASAVWCHPSAVMRPRVVRTVPEFIPRGGGLVVVEVEDVVPSQVVEVHVGSVRGQVGGRRVDGRWVGVAVLRLTDAAAGQPIRLVVYPPTLGNHPRVAHLAAGVGAPVTLDGPALSLEPAETEEPEGAAPTRMVVRRARALGAGALLLEGEFPPGLADVVVGHTRHRVIRASRTRLWIQRASRRGERVTIWLDATGTRKQQLRVRAERRVSPSRSAE